jgi:Fe(3+) dicitrate transport protein
VIRRLPLFVILLCSATAAADPPPVPTLVPVPAPAPVAPRAPLLEVQIIGEKADSLQKIPGAGTVVTSKEIARAAPNDVGELLRRVPGLQVRQEEGGGLRLDVGVRGLDATRSRRVLILEDGIPVAINPYGEPDLYYSPPVERMRGIEVVKGSGSILFGPQTVGGVINFLTLLPPEQRIARVEVQGGEHAFAKILGTYGDATGDTRVVVQGYVKRGDGLRGEAFHAADVFAKLAVPVGHTGELTAKIGFHDEGSNSTDAGLTRPMFLADPGRVTIAPHDTVAVRRYEVSLIHDVALGEGTRLRTLGYTYFTTRSWNRQDYDRTPVAGVAYDRIVGDTSTPGGALFFRDTDTVRDRSYQVFGVEPRLEKRFDTAGVGHTLDAGLRLLYENARRVQSKGATPVAEEGVVTGDERDGSVAFAGYVQDRLAFRDWLLVTPGARVEVVRSHRSISRALVSGSARDVAINGSSALGTLIPGIGMVVGTPRAHVFGGFHVGFAPPRVTSWVDSSGKNLDLAPERSLQYEVGARVAPRKWLKGEATGFLSNFENQIIPSSRAGGDTVDLVNAGRTRHLGLEAAASFGLARMLGWGFDLDLGGRYTFVNAVFAEGPFVDRYLPYSPVHTVAATIDVEHPVGVGAQLAWTMVGSQFADELNTVPVDVTGRIGEIKAHHLIDATARYRHAPTGLTGFVSAKNLLNQIYVGSRRPDGIFPGGFRQVNVGLRWDYR